MEEEEGKKEAENADKACVPSLALPLSNGNRPKQLHDSKGLFVKGSPGGPGNPFAKHVTRLRREMYKEVGKKDMKDIIRTAITKAVEGNPYYTRIVLDYLIPRPKQEIEISNNGEQVKVQIAALFGTEKEKENLIDSFTVESTDETT